MILKARQRERRRFSTETHIPEESAPFAEFEIDELEQLLQDAIAVEDYVKAARIRDELNKRK